MEQSLALTLDVYSAMHFGMKKLYDTLTVSPVLRSAIYYGGTAAGIFAFAYLLPFGYPWLHREFPRTVLSLSGMQSSHPFFNNVVWSFSDQDLERLKAEKPYETIRIYEAGVEGYILFSSSLLRNIFLYNLEDLSNITAFFSTFIGMSHVIPVYAATSGLVNIAGFDLDAYVEARYKDETGQSSTALYCHSSLNWVYDLFRPKEPYSARGAHPTGTGVARYITLKQLTEDETQYLAKQGLLSQINLLSPLLYGVKAFPLGAGGLEGNFAVHHYLTPFGSDIPVQVFLKKAPFNMIFTYHSYQNYNHYFPAVEAELVDLPLRITPQFALLLSPRVIIGIQPKDQAFKTGDPELFGLAGLRVDFSFFKYFFPYFDITMKTDGWAAGNEYLNSNVSFNLGVSMRF
jgi:hypothetical protein